MKIGLGEWKMRNGEKAVILDETVDNGAYIWGGTIPEITGFVSWTREGRFRAGMECAHDIIEPWSNPVATCAICGARLLWQKEIEKGICENCHRAGLDQPSCDGGKKFDAHRENAGTSELTKTIKEVEVEVMRSDLKHGPYCSSYEGIAVIEEAFMGTRKGVHEGELPRAKEKAIQLARAAIKMARFLEGN